MPVYIWLYDSSVTHISNSNNSSPILRSMLTLSLCYLKGESPHTGNSHKFTYSIHLQFSQQFSFFKWSHNFLITDFPLFFVTFFFFFCSLCFFLFFFPNVASLGCGLLTTHSAQEVCCGKTGPCHCFHSSLRTTELNLTPITRSQVPKILTSTYIEVLFSHP